MPIKVHSSFAVHPGEWVRDELVAPRGLTVTEAADALGVTRQAMSAVLNGRAAVSANMAIRMEKAFGVKADTLIRMQGAYDLANARRGAARIKVRQLAIA